ncbi:MAG: homoserine kinase [Peptoniphilus sp.]|nr:homoserine kinase [Peptoniphilus sp.]
MIVRVPATSANLGPGYDCMGIALNLYNDFHFILSDKTDSETEKSLMYQSVDFFYKKNNLKTPDLQIKVTGDIPMSRGLGSSAACIVSSLVFANENSGLHLDEDTLLKYATEIEGHPDNVAPALMGGHVCSFVEGDEIYYYKTDVSERFAIYLLIPDFELKTKTAREVVPKETTLANAVFNISRANLVTQALRVGDFNLLRGAAKDVLHEPYRKKLIRDYEVFKERANSEGAVLFISGAGPSLIVISDGENAQLLEKLKNAQTLDNWRIEELKVIDEGVKII